MLLIVLLIAVPLITALALLFIRGDGLRTAIVYLSACITIVLSLCAAIAALGKPWEGFQVPGTITPIIDIVCIVISIALGAIVIGYGLKYRNPAALVLAGIQLVASLLFELGVAHSLEVENALYIDSLSAVMVLVIGIIGSGICVYALGYMKDFASHLSSGEKDRRPQFFALMFLFLSAMFVIVTSNNLSWMFTGWEITTVCSFLLISYTRTEEAIRNAFRQIIMNLLGGIGFIAALFIIALTAHTLSLDAFLEFGQQAQGATQALMQIALVTLSFAGLTKAAQMPFHTWLLGAMVAPTPTSALLHSSTMVKAGVFLLIKLAPLYATHMYIFSQSMVMLVGGITFMLCSFMAISQSNAKRVLAYSTIANLGLIASCAGTGTPAAIWAAIVLLVFHAATKSLLFLCVGTAEHHIGSRDIEDMDLLFERMPRLARLMMLGILCMFIAPFGMLTAKWATLASFAASNNFVLILLVVFGSAATFLFWAKWLGKLSGIAAQQENVEKTVHTSEWIILWVMAAIALLACIFLPLASEALIVPAVSSTLQGISSVDLGFTSDDLWIAAILAIVVAIALFGAKRNSKQKKADVYLSGVSLDSDMRTYANSIGDMQHAAARNLYLIPLFGESRWKRLGEIICSVILVAALLGGLICLVMGWM